MSFLDPETLRELFRHLAATDIDEVEIEYQGSRVLVRREPSGIFGGAAVPFETAPSQSSDVAVTAPLTGVFYGRPSPDQPPFAAVGQYVEPGQVVALIETMKLFNEVVTDVGGEVSAIAVSDGALVEAGQDLVYITPAGEGDLA